MPGVVLADGLHILGAGGWIGTLLLVVAVGLPVVLRLDASERGPAAGDLINAFSPVALGAAGLLALTGLIAAWVHLGALSALWQTGYGRTLILKLGVLAVVAGTGAYNWRWVRPALGDEVGAWRIRKSATVELAVAAVVLAITAFLVATPTPRSMETGVAGAAPLTTKSRHFDCASTYGLINCCRHGNLDNHARLRRRRTWLTCLPTPTPTTTPAQAPAADRPPAHRAGCGCLG